MRHHEFGQRAFAVEKVSGRVHGNTPIFVRDIISGDDGCPRVNAHGLIAAEAPSMGPVQRGIKRAMDVVLAGIALVILAPWMLMIAIAIRSTSAGPALFRQTRNGYQGRPFTILKFRTMTVMEDGDDVRQAQRNDQRVTRIGRWLRRTSLDELPQLINVLRGEMSLVGPRPHARAHDIAFAKLVAHYEIRQRVKPGITGWAQVNGLRGETSSIESLRQRIEHDLHYTRTANLALDIDILMRTVVVVLSQRNAH
jgi:exopolysaccharide biosynthesis polyprenyl glycosylphosphotransferase